MSSGLVGRQNAMQTKGVPLGGYGGVGLHNNSDEPRTSHALPLAPNFTNGTKGWANTSIWGGGALGGTYSGVMADKISAKTSSGSLLTSSESDDWVRPSPWARSENRSSVQPTSQARIAGVSPVRQRNNNGVLSTQPFVDPSRTASASFFRSTRVGAGPSPKPMNKPDLDPELGSFVASRNQMTVLNGHCDFGRLEDLESPRHSDSATGSWPDHSLTHSPSEERRSVAGPDYVAPATSMSRHGSLPPSRHGLEQSQYLQRSDYPRLSQASANRGHPLSLPSQTDEGTPIDRNDPYTNTVIPQFGQMSLENDSSHSFVPHKSAPAYSSYGSSLARRALSDIPQNALLPAEGGANTTGSFTFNDYPAGHYMKDVAALRNPASGERKVFLNPNKDRHMPSFSTSLYSTGATTRGFDHLHPSLPFDASRMSPQTHSVQLDRRLRGLQQEQQPFLHPQSHQMMTASYLGHYGAPCFYSIPGGVPMNAMTTGTAMQQLMPPVLPALEVSQGPRDHASDGIMSPLMAEFKSNSKTSKRYELKDIYDHIAEFSGDQHGSRFIQQKLETANSDERDRVFRELQPNLLQLMQDVFGNYVIQKFFEHGDQSQKKVIANKMKGQALEHVLTDQQASLVKELENHVLKCVKDQNGNHVIQKAIERVPAEHIQFIIHDVTGQVQHLSTHSYGCRVIQRMLEHCEEPTQTAILQELHACGSALIPDQYGNYVTQHVIEHGKPEDRAKVIELVKAQLLGFSKHKFASNVVEKCLVHGTDAQRKGIMLQMGEKNERGESTLVMLIRDGYGNYVIQKLLDTLSMSDYALFMQMLQPDMVKAKRTASGKQVQAIEKKMHRFDFQSTYCHLSLPSPPASSENISTATTPPSLTSDVQSPESSSHASTNGDSIDGPVQHATPAPPKDAKVPQRPGSQGLSNAKGEQARSATPPSPDKADKPEQKDEKDKKDVGGSPEPAPDQSTMSRSALLDSQESTPTVPPPGSPSAGEAKPLETVLQMQPPSSGKEENSDKSHRPPHLQTPPYVHHFDTYTLVKKLEDGGFSQDQSVTAMKAVRSLLADNMELARDGLNARKAAVDKMRQERTQLQHEVDILNQKMTQESATLKDDLKGMFDDRKMAVRMEQRSMESKIQTLNYRITVALNSDSRSEVEGLRWILTRRAIAAIAIAAFMIIGSLRYASYMQHTQEIERKRMKNQKSEGVQTDDSVGGRDGGSGGGRGIDSGTGGLGEVLVQEGSNPAYVSLG
ncbi:hypothetical protein B0A49_06169 [Cryomyces minteri]|uniref:PUM-HD domain-containing protein n=1 Tax=Cryomyces minteri TaxID=331657 RepID=A0A4U0X8D1_9PEZI|nr:hypothetical protein B0A49_06169 [Cryomyces minteri]